MAESKTVSELREEMLVEKLAGGGDAKRAEHLVNDAVSVQAIIERLDVEPPKRRPLVRNRNPTFDVSRQECMEMKGLHARDVSVSDIASRQMLPKRVVEAHIGQCEKHTRGF